MPGVEITTRQLVNPLRSWRGSLLTTWSKNKATRFAGQEQKVKKTRVNAGGGGHGRNETRGPRPGPRARPRRGPPSAGTRPRC